MDGGCARARLACPWPMGGRRQRWTLIVLRDRDQEAVRGRSAPKPNPVRYRHVRAAVPAVVLWCDSVVPSLGPGVSWTSPEKPVFCCHSIDSARFRSSLARDESPSLEARLPRAAPSTDPRTDPQFEACLCFPLALRHVDRRSFRLLGATWRAARARTCHHPAAGATLGCFWHAASPAAARPASPRTDRCVGNVYM